MVMMSPGLLLRSELRDGVEFGVLTRRAQIMGS